MQLNLEIWNKETYKEFIDYLYSISDNACQDFNNKIVPNSKSHIIGIRVPKMRDTAKSIAKGNAKAFLDFQETLDKSDLTHEEITMYGLVIAYAKFTYDENCTRIKYYSKIVNNWACCDVPVSSFKFIKNFTTEYKYEIEQFLSSDNLWVQRVGTILLLDHYLDTEDNVKYSLEQVNDLKSDEYYVQMGQAWLIATAFSKFRDITKTFLENDFALNNDVKKMTIRKLRDSYLISKEDKDWTKTW